MHREHSPTDRMVVHNSNEINTAYNSSSQGDGANMVQNDDNSVHPNSAGNFIVGMETREKTLSVGSMEDGSFHRDWGSPNSTCSSYSDFYNIYAASSPVSSRESDFYNSYAVSSPVSSREFTEFCQRYYLQYWMYYTCRRPNIGSSTVAIDNKIEQAMDLVKSHLMYAVREEVEVLKEQIKELMEKNSQLEHENSILKASASQETLNLLSQPRQSQPPSSSS